MKLYNQAYFEKTGIKVTQQASPSQGNVQSFIEKAHQLATARHPNTMSIPKLRKFVQQYPNIPQFKNYLIALLGRLKRIPEMEVVATECYEKHPDYLFGRINFAEVLLRKKEVERAAAILGLSNEGVYFLKNQEILHESELMSYGKVAFEVAIAQNNLDEAKQQLERLWLYDEKNVMVLEQVKILVANQLIASPIFKRAKNKRTVKFMEHFCPEQTTEKPVFHHSEVEQLYRCGGKLESEEWVHQLLSLPRETLVADLRKILKDAVVRRDVFFPPNEEDEDLAETNLPHIKHVANLLAIWNVETALEDLLNFLRQDLEILDCWSGDLVMDYEMPVYLLGRHQLNVLQNFILQRGNNEMSRNVISHAVAQVVLHEPERRAEVVEWFRKVIQTHLDNPKDNGLIDSFVLTFIIGDVLKFRGVELESEIQQLFETGWINEGDFGDFKSVQKDLYSEMNPCYKKQIPKNIFEFYIKPQDSSEYEDKWMEEILNKPLFDQFLDSERMGLFWKGIPQLGLGEEDNYEDEEEDMPDSIEWQDEPPEDEDIYEELTHKPMIFNPSTLREPPATPKKSEKIGRNELCSCGSGKKYKKCHGA